MRYQYLVFDLDGTISDPKEGITKCFNFALDAFGFPTHHPDLLEKCIGPPLDRSFAEITGSNDKAIIDALVAKYRERYATEGFAENALYPDMPRLLKVLSEQPDIQLGLCTSKRVDFAHQILQLFGIHQHFTFVSGGDAGIEKGTQIASLLEQGTINASSIMIGDRYFDLVAAQQNNIPCAAVLWGYGSPEELGAHSPDFTFASPEELLQLKHTNESSTEL